MKEAKKLYNALQDALNGGDEVFVANVKTVDKAACTCTVIVDELEIGNVRLRATINPVEKGIKIFPLPDSVVLVQKLGDKEEMFVTLYSEVEAILFETDTTIFQVMNGFKMVKGTDSVKALVADLISAIKALTVPTGTGPSGVPINIAAFAAIETRANNLFN